MPVPCLWLVVCSTAALQHCSTTAASYLVLDPVKLQPGLQLQAERGDGGDLQRGRVLVSGLGWLEVQLSSYLGRPGELEQVHHVLLEVLHVGHGLLGLGLLLGLLGLLWLLLILLLLKCQG